jgi:signal transduction histidine kinase
VLTKLPGIPPYLLAVLTVFLALQAKWFVQPYISTSPPFMLFLAAVMVTAWHGGFRPALFATILSAFVINYYFIFPLHNFFPISLPDLGTLIFFGGVTTILAYSIDYLQRARRDAVSIQKQLERLHELSRQLLKEDAFEPMLRKVLTSALELLRADKGMVHLYEPEKEMLVLHSHVGFTHERFSSHFQEVSLNFSSCGAAFQRQERVSIDHSAADPLYAHLATLPGMSDVVAAQSMPLFRADRGVFGVLTTYHTRPHLVSNEEFHLIDLYARQAERILEAKYHEEGLRRANGDLEANLHRLIAELAVTEDRERRHLASELPDHLAQLLTLGQLKLKLAQKFISHSPGTSERYIQETAEAITLSLQYARTMMAELCPPELYESGLVAAVQWLAAQMPKHGLTVDLDISAHSFVLSNEQAGLLYKSIRELLINVVKHAVVDRASVSICVDPSHTLVIRVQDEGRGFDTSSATPTDGGVHFGLGHISERMIVMGGLYRAESTIGHGTTITLSLPLRMATESLRAASAHQGDRVKARPQALPTQEPLFL